MSPFQMTAAHRCCSNCAGVGKLTSSVSTVYLGRLHHHVTVRICTACDGSGFKTAKDRLVVEGC